MPQLRKFVNKVISHGYESTQALLDREFDSCNIIYLLGDTPTSFFMVNYHNLHVGTQVIPCVYLGLSGTVAKRCNTGEVRALYSALIDDVSSRVMRNGVDYILWGTTATPSVLFAFQRLFPNPSPTDDGLFPTEYNDVAESLRSYLSLPPDHRSPYVLRGYANNTRYSQTEQLRIETIESKHGPTLLTSLNIDEAQGDRMLMLARSSR